MKFYRNTSRAIILALLFFSAIESVGAQKFTDKNIRISANRMELDGDDLFLDFDIHLKKLKVTTGKQLVFTPVIYNETKGRELELPMVVLNGRRRDNIFQRMAWLNEVDIQNSVYRTIRMEGKEFSDAISYIYTLPGEDWMEGAEVLLRVDRCGCGGTSKDGAEYSVGEGIRIAVPPIVVAEPIEEVKEVVPLPEPEEKHVRSEEGSAFIIFRTGQHEIVPELGINREELRKISESLRTALSHRDAQITAIYIEAYASPEGSPDSNLTLSRERAVALRDYICRYYGIAPHLLHAEGMGIDWDGLIRLAEEDPFLEYRNEVLHILRYTEPSLRESRLAALAGGAPYRYLFNSLYPRLRRSDYRIEYVVPDVPGGRNR